MGALMVRSHGDMNLYVLIGYLVVLVAATQLLSGRVRSPVVQALRAFFPSWKFFDEPGEVPCLLVRTGADAETLSSFEPLLPPLKRPITAALFNPRGNLWLAYGSLLQQLMSELEELPEGSDADTQIRSCTSYQLTQALVLERLRERGQALPRYYQFKVVTFDAEKPQLAPTDVLISAVCSS